VALVMCGGRWQEVASLTWDRVDLAARTVRLWGSKVQRERMVPLPEQFAAVLERRWAERDAGQPLIFPLGNGKQRLGRSQGIPAAFAACGINRPELVATIGKATVHSLRHTFASWLVQHGADLAEVQDALGHSSIVMTRRYAALAKEKTVAKLGSILSNIGAAA